MVRNFQSGGNFREVWLWTGWEVGCERYGREQARFPGENVPIVNMPNQPD